MRDHQERNNRAVGHCHLHSGMLLCNNHKLASAVEKLQISSLLMSFVHELPRSSFSFLVHLSNHDPQCFLLEVHVPLTAAHCLSLHLSLLPYVLLKCVHSCSCVGSFCLSSGSHGHGHHLHSLCCLCRCSLTCVKDGKYVEDYVYLFIFVLG